MILPLVFVSLLKRLLMLTVHCHNKCFQNFLCIPLLLGRTVLQHHGGQGACSTSGRHQKGIYALIHENRYSIPTPPIAPPMKKAITP